jgi:rubrerythrin
MDLLVQAYRNEKKEIHKYSLALNLFKDDERAAGFFKKLIADETLHMKWIGEKIKVLDADFYKKFDRADVLIMKVNEEYAGKIQAVDMLEYNLYEEKFGALFHKLCSNELKTPELKELFRELEAAETAHINSIKYEIDFLKNLSVK